MLRQAGWRGNPFLGVKLVDPTWTRTPRSPAQTVLAQWQQRQVQTRQQRSGLEARGAAPGDEENTVDVEERETGKR